MDSLPKILTHNDFESDSEDIYILENGFPESQIPISPKKNNKKDIHRLDDLISGGSKKLHTENGEVLKRSSSIELWESQESLQAHYSIDSSQSRFVKQSSEREGRLEERNESDVIEVSSVASEFSTIHEESKSSQASSYPQNSDPVVLILDDDDEDENEAILGRIYNNNFKRFMTPLKWQNQDFDEWYICEKTGGVRCYWNGSQLLSQTFKAFHVPKEVIKGFPKACLDLELVMENGCSDDVYEILRKDRGQINDWRKLYVNVLDAPGLDFTFSERLRRMKQRFETIESPYIRLERYRVCKNRENLINEMEVIKSKKEVTSIILIDPENMYEQGKSTTMFEILLIKQEEAEIVGYEKVRGHEGKINKLEVRNNDGMKFSIGVGLTDEIKRSPPRIGSKIKYSFQETGKSGVPKRARLDIIL